MKVGNLVLLIFNVCLLLIIQFDTLSKTHLCLSIIYICLEDGKFYFTSLWDFMCNGKVIADTLHNPHSLISVCQIAPN